MSEALLNTNQKEKTYIFEEDRGEQILALLPHAPLWTAKQITKALDAEPGTIRNVLVRLARAKKIHCQVQGGRKPNLYRPKGKSDMRQIPHSLGITDKFNFMYETVPKGYALEKSPWKAFKVGKMLLRVDGAFVLVRERDNQWSLLPTEEDKGSMRRQYKAREPHEYRRKYWMMKQWWLREGQHLGHALHYLTFCEDEVRMQFLMRIAEDVGKTQGENDVDCRTLYWFTMEPQKIWEKVWTVPGMKGRYSLVG